MSTLTSLVALATLTALVFLLFFDFDVVFLPISMFMGRFGPLVLGSGIAARSNLFAATKYCVSGHSLIPSNVITQPGNANPVATS